MKILNIGCGMSKIDNADNVDIDKTHADEGFCFDVRRKFPIEDEIYDEVCFFHTIEHIQKKFHRQIFMEIHRVLKQDGDFYLAYPEFGVIAANWVNNHQGNREFWERTIYGRQLTDSDYHVCVIDSTMLKEELKIMGFYDIDVHYEVLDPYNAVLRCKRGEPMKSYERVLYDEVIAR